MARKKENPHVLAADIIIKESEEMAERLRQNSLHFSHIWVILAHSCIIPSLLGSGGSQEVRVVILEKYNSEEKGSVFLPNKLTYNESE